MLTPTVPEPSETARHQQRPLAPLPFAERTGVAWVATANLRNAQFQLANPGLEPPGLVPVAIPLTLGGSLMRAGPYMFFHFRGHRDLNHFPQKMPQAALL